MEWFKKPRWPQAQAATRCAEVQQLLREEVDVELHFVNEHLGVFVEEGLKRAIRSTDVVAAAC